MPASRRAIGWAIALAIELLLVLALLTLGRGQTAKPPEERRLVSFDVAPNPDPTPERAPPSPTVEARPPTSPPVPVTPAEPIKPALPTTASPKRPVPSPIITPTPIIELPRGSMASADIRSLPSGPPATARRAAAGPPSPGAIRGDTPLAEGHGPNGEKLYAASWYREPYDNELRGYLSTAQGPGYALIACKTVPDFRVDDCVALDEYPTNSRIARAVLAAAWQFRVRPPQIGGTLQVGEWVRIRIDYTDRAKG